MVKQINISLMVLSAFLAGACSILVAQPLIVPPAHADTNPQKWEYSCLSQIGSRVRTVNLPEMQAYGLEGWELASGAGEGPTNDRLICFKRPLA